MTVSLKTFITRQEDDKLLATASSLIDYKLLTNDYLVKFTPTKAFATIILEISTPFLSSYVCAAILRAYREAGWNVINMCQDKGKVEVRFRVRSLMLPEQKRV